MEQNLKSSTRLINCERSLPFGIISRQRQTDSMRYLITYEVWTMIVMRQRRRWRRKAALNHQSKNVFYPLRCNEISCCVKAEEALQRSVDQFINFHDTWYDKELCIEELSTMFSYTRYRHRHHKLFSWKMCNEMKEAFTDHVAQTPSQKCPELNGFSNCLNQEIGTERDGVGESERGEVSENCSSTLYLINSRDWMRMRMRTHSLERGLLYGCN